MSRFRRRDLVLERGPVRTYRGLDSVTGLPVLIYRFPGAPLDTVTNLDSEHAPGVLAASHGEEGEVVVAFSPKYRSAPTPLPADLLRPAVEGSARALRDAAVAGVIHGDIEPGRFLFADGHLLIEGFGARWSSRHAVLPEPERSQGASYAGDVYSWAKSIRILAGDAVPADLDALLYECEALEARARPNARTIFERVQALGWREVRQRPSTPVPAARPSLTKPDRRVVDTAVLEEGVLVLNSDPGVRPRPPSAPNLHERDEPILKRTSVEPAPAETTGSFVKRPPPGATYRMGTAGEHDDARSRRLAAKLEGERAEGRGNARGIGLIIVVALAVLLGSIALWRQSDQTIAAFSSPGQSQFIVDVAVEPTALRNVTLFVVASPPGSSFRPGHEIAFVPGPAVLDSAGTWQLRARFQNRVSDVVALQVPADRSVLLTFPPVTP